MSPATPAGLHSTTPCVLFVCFFGWVSVNFLRRALRADCLAVLFAASGLQRFCECQFVLAGQRSRSQLSGFGLQVCCSFSSCHYSALSRIAHTQRNPTRATHTRTPPCPSQQLRAAQGCCTGACCVRKTIAQVRCRCQYYQRFWRDSPPHCLPARSIRCTQHRLVFRSSFFVRASFFRFTLQVCDLR